MWSIRVLRPYELWSRVTTLMARNSGISSMNAVFMKFANDVWPKFVSRALVSGLMHFRSQGTPAPSFSLRLHVSA